MFLRLTLLALLALQLAMGRGQKKAGEERIMRPNPAAAAVDAGGLASCPAGSPLGEMKLTVRSGKDREPLPFENIIHLTEGDVVEYAPVERGRRKREGEVSLVLVPAKISGREELIVTDPENAEKPQHWEIPRTVALAVFVYGPQGLSRKRVKSFLSQDESLVAQLAEYADKTAQTEALIAALSNSERSSASVNAALNGFASQYGVSVQLDKNAPPATQAQALFSAMNPQLSSYSPLASSASARASQTASLATAAAGLFFGSPVGLLAGGTSMLLDLRSIAFPDTQFRSSFALTLKDSHLNLCGERLTTPGRTRLAYLWASRIPNASKPNIQIGNANYLPLQEKSPLPVTLSDGDWKYLQRARNWYLENDAKQRYPVNLLKLQNQKAVEIDLSEGKVKPGEYRLGAFWDWKEFSADGDVHVRALSGLDSAQLVPDSQDRLLAGGGKVPVTVSGSDFEFTTKVEVTKVGDEFAAPMPVRYILPKGLRRGPQMRVDVLIDTDGLSQGDYRLLFSQVNGETHAIPFKLLPNPPKVANLPILLNAGAETHHYVLKGERLDAISKLEAPGATFELGGVSNNNSQRNLTVELDGSVKPGTKVPVTVHVKDRNEPLSFSNAMEITGPLPVIASSKLAIPPGVAVSLRPDEFPAGYAISATIDVKNMDPRSVVQLGCANGVTEPVRLQIGEQNQAASLQQLSPDQLYLLFDTAHLPAGCQLQASVDNGRGGKSQPYDLARITRLPQIESLTPVEPAATAGTPADTEPNQNVEYVFRGSNLEMIERAGWDPGTGTEVTALPTPIPGEGQKQTLSIAMPAPQTGKDELYLWLRGDKQARTTTIKLPNSTAAVPPELAAKMQQSAGSTQ